MQIDISLTRRQADRACDAIAERLDSLVTAVDCVEDGDYRDYGPEDLPTLRAMAADMMAVLRALHRALGVR